ncbi:hypothetical protein PROFUN_12965 [Planoprotostelium fungivorum]|uniref:Phospholipid-transporting ATPase n=1 Tax=Planoprotostelium fungivorum TaxID=1890364 RepID=A0A2P6MZI3_9EUKA|nr:hypothetical protein PROFUN_12965 [Planoprotostelium fungivorum]
MAIHMGGVTLTTATAQTSSSLHSSKAPKKIKQKHSGLLPQNRRRFTGQTLPQGRRSHSAFRDLVAIVILFMLVQENPRKTRLSRRSRKQIRRKTFPLILDANMAKDSHERSPLLKRHKKQKDDEEEDKPIQPASRFGRTFRKIFTSQAHERKSTEEKEDEFETNAQGLREVYAGYPEKHIFRHGNGVKTSKYSLLTFPFLNTWEQFRRLANLYFLINSIIALFPSISPVNPITTILPLAFVFGVTAIKEAWEDWKRHRADHKVNSFNCQVFDLQSGKFEKVKWSKLKAGHIVKIKEKQQIPADVVLLSSSEEKGIAFVEASSLDGEAGLRRREPLKQTADLNNEEALKEWLQQGVIVECERPNERMSSFEGRIKFEESNEKFQHESDREEESEESGQLPLTMKQMLLRSCTLESTEWAVGIVVYTGHDTRTMRNAKSPQFKLSAFEHSINHFLILLLVYTLIIMVASALTGTLWQNSQDDSLWYLPLSDSPFITFLMLLPTFLILYNVTIPISLYVSMEMVKVALTFFVSHDIKMYDEGSDTRAKPRTSSIIEELGQIGYVFADKTGTLTVNVMKLITCSINEKLYDFPRDEEEEEGESVDTRAENPEKSQNILEYLGADGKGKKGRGGSDDNKDKVDEFMFLLAICNSVIPQPNPDNPEETLFAGSSPDESALVESAKKAGYVLQSRTMETVKINDEEYKVLNNIEFTSDRKKMSSIIRTKDNKIVLYTKGADSAILENLTKDDIRQKTEEHIKSFAENGLRTLCMAKKEIDESTYKEWNDKYKKASSSLRDRDKKMDEVSAEIEKDLELIGAVAIEDKLQKKVPQSIQTLRDAGLKVWVLTGDKLETAVNIAKTANLINPEEMNVVTVRKDDGDVIEQLQKAKSKWKKNTGEKENALVVDGSALTEIFKKNKKDFYKTSKQCKSVLVCRASPLQKSEVVALYKEMQKKKLLAIGDGANDVSMIREAHVGVGISGREGMQAAMSSDYAIAQFRFLVPLLLVHGRWAYKRLSKLVLYSFYKNITFCMCQFWFAYYNRYSGQTLFDSWSLSMFNTLFTSLPILVVAAFDQDVSRRSMKDYPQLYRESIDKPSFSLKWATLWFVEGIIHSAIIFFGVVFLFSQGAITSHGHDFGLWTLGTAVYTVVIITVNVKLALEVNSWNLWILASLVFSVVIWFVWLALFSFVPPSANALFNDNVLYGVPIFLLRSYVFWSCCILLPFLCLIPDFGYKYLRRRYNPFNWQIVEEIEKFGVDQEKRPKKEKKKRHSNRTPLRSVSEHYSNIEL